MSVKKPKSSCCRSCRALFETICSLGRENTGTRRGEKTLSPFLLLDHLAPTTPWSSKFLSSSSTFGDVWCQARERVISRSRPSLDLHLPWGEWEGGGGGAQRLITRFLEAKGSSQGMNFLPFTFSAPCQMTPVLTSFPLGNRKYFIPWWRKQKANILSFRWSEESRKNSNV